MSKSQKLSNKFVFWYHINEISADQEYESQIKKLAEFETLEDFWAIFQYLKKPDDCKQAIEFQLFKNQIKPMWEDENNKNGGRIALKLRKEFSNLVWEELVFAFIGGYFDKEIKDEINGLVINCKKDFNTLQIWIKTYTTEVTSALEKNIREILNIPNEVALDIKPFNQPQKDYSNYNNNYNNNNYNQYYNNYNNYKGYNQKKKQNNNYYKKRGSKEVKEYKNYNNNEAKKNNEKEEDKKVSKTEEDNTKKEKEVIKEEVEKEAPKEKVKKKEKEKEELKEKEKEKEKEEVVEKKESKEEFTEVKKKKKKKKE